MHFFHCDTQRYIKRRKYILWIALLPLFQSAVIILLITIVNLRVFYENGYLRIVIYAVTGAAGFGALLFFTVFALTEKAVKRNARYTFFEIGGKALVFSRYSGDLIEQGKLCPTRVLIVIPLSELKSAGFNRRSGVIYLNMSEKGGGRKYTDRTERLNYRLAEGFPDFESWWYNQNGFKSLPVVKIPGIFGKTGNSKEFSKKLFENITQAKRNFDSTPKIKPYSHKEPDFIKRKKALDTLLNLMNK